MASVYNAMVKEEPIPGMGISDVKASGVEPYVVAADVYALPPHTGRGGWTWYTGSAGWMYRLIVESLLGLRLEVDKLRFAPCLPADWTGFKMYYRYREAVYEIDVRQQPGGESRTIVTADGVELRDETIPLVDDRRNRSVLIKPASRPIGQTPVQE